ncbi:MAG: BrnT family toxin [Pseudomonadota bacterium]
MQVDFPCNFIYCAYNKDVEIEFDPKKNEANLRKHGCELSLAKYAEWEEALFQLDLEADFEEEQVIAILPIGNRIFYLVFVFKGDVKRIISLRLASN